MGHPGITGGRFGSHGAYTDDSCKWCHGSSRCNCDVCKITTRSTAGNPISVSGPCQHCTETKRPRRIFVVSPFRGNIPANRFIVRAITSYLLKKGYAAFASHAFYTDLLDDAVEEERELGMAAGRAFLQVCDEVLLYDGKGTSTGMIRDLDDADRFHITVRHLTDIHEMTPNLDNPFVETVTDKLVPNGHGGLVYETISICCVCEEPAQPTHQGTTEEVWGKHRKCLREGRPK